MNKGVVINKGVLKLAVLPYSWVGVGDDTHNHMMQNNEMCTGILLKVYILINLFIY